MDGWGRGASAQRGGERGDGAEGVACVGIPRADSSHGFHAAPFKRTRCKKDASRGRAEEERFMHSLRTLTSVDLDNLRTRRRNMREAQEGDRFGRRDEGLATITPVAGVERRHDAARGSEWRAVEPNLARE